MSGRSRWVKVIAFWGICALSTPVLGQESQSRTSRNLLTISARLVPYDREGNTFSALRDLEEMSHTANKRTQVTARFLRAAVTLDFMAYSHLSHVESADELRQNLADVYSTTVAMLPERLEIEFLEASQGFFSVEAGILRSILRCLCSTPEGLRSRQCTGELHRAALSRSSGATAATLLLLDDLLLPLNNSVTSPDEAAELHGTLAANVCTFNRSSTVRNYCRHAEQTTNEEERAEWQIRAVMRYVSERVTELRRFAAAGEPLSVFAADWIASSTSRLGGAIVRQPLSNVTFAELSLPSAASAATLPPAELLIVSRVHVAVAVTPATVETWQGALRLDQQTGLSLPGQQVLSLPARFKQTVRPIDEVSTALEDMRSRIDGVLERVGCTGPQCFGHRERRPLGLVIDGQVNLIDLARYVASAHQAGYQQFVLLGRRSDGELAVINAEFASVRHHELARHLPRLNIGVRLVRFTPNDGYPITVHRTEMERLVAQAAEHLDTGPIMFTAFSRPMMPYRLVLPSIDAVAAIAPGSHRSMLLFLPL